MLILLYTNILQVLSEVSVEDGRNVDMLFKTLCINIFTIKWQMIKVVIS